MAFDKSSEVLGTLAACFSSILISGMGSYLSSAETRLLPVVLWKLGNPFAGAWDVFDYLRGKVLDHFVDLSRTVVGLEVGNLIFTNLGGVLSGCLHCDTPVGIFT